jgi:hypothetical protein
MSFKQILGRIAPLVSPSGRAQSPQRIYAEDILSTWAASPSLGNLFLVIFDFNSISALKDPISNLNFLEDNTLWPWDSSAISTLLQKDFQNNSSKLLGCVFAREVKMPGESIQAGVGSSYGGHPGMPYIQGRSEFGKLTMTFLETNASFCDLIIRPWAILTGYYGLIARSQRSPKNVKCRSVDVYELAKGGGDSLINISSSGLMIKKQFNYSNVVPVSVDDSSVSHATEGFTNRNVTFLYESYSIRDGSTYR